MPGFPFSTDSRELRNDCRHLRSLARRGPAPDLPRYRDRVARPLLDEIDGFISIERFESIHEPGKMLSLSFWRDDEAVREWRALEDHRAAQRAGRNHVFRTYRLRIAGVIRDYGMTERSEAPSDSLVVHDAPYPLP